MFNMLYKISFKTFDVCFITITICFRFTDVERGSKN